jgi:DUF2892 family protein
MKSNISNTNRIIRLSVAAIIITLYFTNVIAGTLATVLLVMAGMMMITGAVSFCPMAMAGICPGDLINKIFSKKEE